MCLSCPFWLALVELLTKKNTHLKCLITLKWMLNINIKCIQYILFIYCIDFTCRIIVKCDRYFSDVNKDLTFKDKDKD